jgi:CBS domain-containing membrane protein
MKKKIRRSWRIVKFVVYKETMVNAVEILWTSIGSFIGIGIIGYLHSGFMEKQDTVFLIGSFGASAVLVYGIPNSPLARGRNVVGGHLISALVGVTIAKLVPQELWLSAGMAVSISIVLMQITKTLHPPGGATALIAVIGSAKIKSLGYLYLFFPVLSGIAILMSVAFVINSMSPMRSSKI